MKKLTKTQKELISALKNGSTLVFESCNPGEGYCGWVLMKNGECVRTVQERTFNAVKAAYPNNLDSSNIRGWFWVEGETKPEPVKFTPSSERGRRSRNHEDYRKIYESNGTTWTICGTEYGSFYAYQAWNCKEADTGGFDNWTMTAIGANVKECIQHIEGIQKGVYLPYYTK